ncbi:MAG TPA: DUF4395 domain-containing protein [Marmoricola sp.]|nr:DUF4395 domain-containing protein [Marmoricola sp.]
MSSTPNSARNSTAGSITQIDPRGPRFTAAITLAIFAVVLVAAPAPAAIALLAVQAACFAIGATRGVQHTPTAYLVRTLVRPRLTPPAELEDAAPPRFAQTVGLVFALVALAGYLSGATLLGQIAAGFALAAALLNAVFGFCLGCEMYLLLHRSALRPALAHHLSGASASGTVSTTKTVITTKTTTKEEVTA